MLPEHKETLKKMWNKKEQNQRRQLDEQLLEQFNNRLSAAYIHKRPVQITYYMNDTYDKLNLCNCIGHIDRVDANISMIEVEGVSICIRDIVNVEFVNEMT